jgi:hypothetical protein
MLALRVSGMSQSNTPMWGVQKISENSFVVSKEYLQWLAFLVDEQCQCFPHIDHSDCLAECTAFVDYFTKKQK